MTDRFRDYFEDRLDVMVVSGDELRLRECLFCGRPRTMKVNIAKLKFICFHGDCQATGSVVRLVMVVEGCTKGEAIRIVTDLARGIVKARHTVEELEDVADRLEDPTPEDDEKIGLEFPLPDEFVPCWDGQRWRIPKYLKRRRIKKRTLKKWGIGYADRGTYGGRIIVPIRCAGMSSFVARAASDHLRPKYLTPGRSASDEMLFGYDALKPQGVAVAVEGTFDAMRCDSYGWPTVAYLHDKLSPPQVDLLVRRRVRRLILLPDANMLTQALSSAPSLEGRFDEVLVGRLVEGDPDGAGRAAVETALHDARPAHLVDFLDHELSSLESPW